MLNRFFASWLVVLVLVPFTEPFSICEVASVLGHADGRQAPAPRPSVATIARVAIPTAFYASNGGRIRPMPVHGTAEPLRPGPSPAATPPRATVCCARGHAASSAVMRV